MPGRTTHNLWNQVLFGFTGNDIHSYMDRAAKGLRQKHREIGHDIPALIEMLIKFSSKYKPMQVLQAWALHKYLDGLWSGMQAGVKAKFPNYGKKQGKTNQAVWAAIEKLKKEIFR